MNMFLTKEGVVAIRNFAKVMPKVVTDIHQDTLQLLQTYQDLEERLGVHSNDFKRLLLVIQKSELYAAEAVSELPKKLEKTAQKIEDYLADTDSEADVPPIRKKSFKM